jgi:hypothetical protein
VSIPFDIPAQFAQRYASGLIDRHGAILTDHFTGRIVGHLQETGALHSLLVSAPLNPLGALVNAASGLGANFQLYRLDQKISAMQTLMSGLQALQFANLALTGLGIGVSVLGFAALKSQLDAISLKIDGLEDMVRRGFDKQLANRLRDREAELSGHLDHAEEGWSARNGRKNWESVTAGLGTLQNFYKNEIEGLSREGAAPAAFAYMVNQYRVCVATKIECLILCDEFGTAAEYAMKSVGHSSELFDGLDPANLANSFRRVVTSAEVADPELLKVSRSMMVGIRELQDLHASMPSLIRRIEGLDVSGRDYILRLRDEKAEPVVILPAPGSVP